MNKEQSLAFEKEHLREVKEWLTEYISKKMMEQEELENRIAVMKKASKGSYSYELETNEQLYNLVKKNVSKYTESKVQPYFARIDFREYKREKESLYIGKNSLGDVDTGDEKVIDWRSPIADLYYSGTEGKVYYKAPCGVIDGELSLKRKFLFEDGEIKDIFDESINEIIINNLNEEGSELVDEFLKINLEKSSGNKLKDIVATIQKEQNEIIRLDKNTPIIVQGAAGSGKTTVALHRLAYLLYRYKENIGGENILVLAPNSIFLDYISDVLPSLGVEKVMQSTIEEFLLKIMGSKGKIISKDDKLSRLQKADEKERKAIIEECGFKGSLFYKDMIDRYIKILEFQEAKVEDIKIDQWILFKADEIKRLFMNDMSNLSINKRKEEIKRYFSKKLKETVGKTCSKIELFYEFKINKCKKEMEDGPERRKALIAIYDERDGIKKDIVKHSKVVLDDYFNKWLNKDSRDLYRKFLSYEERFGELTDGIVEESLWNNIRENTLKTLDEGLIDADDCAAMAYLKMKVHGLPKMAEIKHIVIDESQDYSPFQLYTASLIASGKSMTIVGDIGQGIYYYRGINDWNDVINGVFEGKCSYKMLTQSYRSTIEIIEFANKVLLKQKADMKPTKPVIRHGMKPQVESYISDDELIEKVNSAADKVLGDGKKSIAIVCRTYDECKKAASVLKKKNSKFKWKLIKENDKSIKDDFIIIPSHLTKGLEFDCVIVYDCSEVNYTESEFDKKLLYVVLTRALHYEFVFYKEKFTKLLE